MSEVVKIRRNLVLNEDVLKGLIDQSNDIESCAVVIKWKDGSCTTGWSNMNTSTLCFMAMLFQYNVIKDSTEYEV